MRFYVLGVFQRMYRFADMSVFVVNNYALLVTNDNSAVLTDMPVLNRSFNFIVNASAAYQRFFHVVFYVFKI